jgi:hypothetical protein
LKNTRLKSLVLSGSRVATLDAENVKFDGDVLLQRGFLAIGAVKFVRCRILGNLNCHGAQFVGDPHGCLYSDYSVIDGTRRGGHEHHGEVLMFRGAEFLSFITQTALHAEGPQCVLSKEQALPRQQLPGDIKKALFALCMGIDLDRCS